MDRITRAHFSFLLLILTLCLSACGDSLKEVTSVLNSDSDAIPEESYPFNRQLTNRQGKRINATVTGRNLTKVMFVSTKDNKEYLYSLNKLSKEDQQFIKKLPLYSPPGSPLATSSKSKALSPGRRSSIKRIDANIADIDKEIERFVGNTLKTKALYKQRQKLVEEKEALQREL